MSHRSLPRREPYRPQIHYTPARNWMNDPNGLVWHDGEYHLFYQYNPEGDQWGNMSWGHAVSPDLVHWEELGTAIPATEDEHVFSGSVVIDEHGTAGFGRSAAVAVYTASCQRTGVQTQALASSADRGRTWTRYRGNPVLDIGSKDFRDPKVFWYAEGGYWIMAIARCSERRIALYRSADLKAWTWLSDFGPAGATLGEWEMPDLFRLPLEGGGSRWVMLVSVNPGGPAGGSGVQYFVGDFDGVTFTPEDASGSWADVGRDFYAAATWEGTPEGRRCLIGWMANWGDAAAIPTHPWRGAMTLSRELSLVTAGGRTWLAQRPVAAVRDLRAGEPFTFGDLEVRGDVPLLGHLDEGALEVTAEFEPGTAERAGLVLGDGAIVIGYDARTGELFAERGPGPVTAGRHGGTAVLRDGRIRFTAYVDACSVEVFSDDGRTVITDLFFPERRALGLSAVGGTASLVSLVVQPLRPARRDVRSPGPHGA
ncbi:glycoside hydrolase family 32 protein [Thermoactinospora rubra]|uniref:glycoside hydrolase family 32 protein n=1 Tax=Thermoactinospora rubra TaxID=1088767 RepID=UPI0019819456|nr:glycoside hydrolase family 32 protein [Thermoactinospora rubra]